MIKYRVSLSYASGDSTHSIPSSSVDVFANGIWSFKSIFIACSNRSIFGLDFTDFFS